MVSGVKTRTPERYCTWSDLAPTFTRLIEKSWRILNVGCGNSSLPADLYSAGYHHVTSVDNAETAVLQLRQTYAHLEGLHFMVDDVTKVGEC